MPRRLAPLLRGLVALALVAPAVTGPAAAAAATPSVPGRGVLSGPDHRAAPAQQLIVRYRPGLDALQVAAIRGRAGLSRVRALPSIGAEVVRPVSGHSLAEAVSALRQRADVVYAVPDYRRQVFDAPANEPLWPCQWDLENTGLPVTSPSLSQCNHPGKAGVDIRARAAQAVTTGDPNLVVAVIDDGVDFSHPDLADRAWTNPGEVAGNGIDDDGDGLVDDVNGYDFCHDDGTVHDPDNDYHGTAVASLIAASANGVGMTGVAPSVHVMALKFLDDPANGEPTCGNDSDAIAAIGYAVAHGARIINASWGGPDYSQALKDAIDAAGRAGVLFVAAAGNYGVNADVLPEYPAAFTSTNIVSVGAVDERGALADFSNYGRTSVDIVAPGVDMTVAVPPYADWPSPWILGSVDGVPFSGTSFATPLVSGVAALTLAVRPDLGADPAALRARLLATGRPLPSTAGLTVTGRIIDASRAVDLVPPAAVAPSVALGTTSPSAVAGVLHVMWPASTDASGIASYAVRRRLDLGPWRTVASARTTTSLDVAVPFGSTVAFEVRAVDGAGNAGPWQSTRPIRLLAYQESSLALTYTPAWPRVSSSTALGGRVRYATRSGARATLSFTGRSVAWVGPLGPTRGSAKVYVDGRYIRTVSLHARTTVGRQVLFTRSWIAPGSHTLRIVAVGTRGHPRVDVDGFLVAR